MLWYSQMLCCCSHYVQPVTYLPRQSASRRSAGISKDYSSTSSTSLLYLQCFVQTHLIVPFIHCSFLLYRLRPPVSQCKVITFSTFNQYAHISVLQLILLLFSCNLYFNVCTIHFMFINFSLFNISLSVYSCRVAFPNKRHKNNG